MYLEAVVRSNPGLLTMKPSGLEGVGTPAIFLDVELPAFLRRIRGRRCTSTLRGALMLTLSLADAEDVVTKGWGAIDTSLAEWEISSPGAMC